jgi:hypothetical protein
MTPDEVDAVMAKVHPDWRERWCESSLCACMGCTNSSGGARAAGVTKEEWEAWKVRHQAPGGER